NRFAVQLLGKVNRFLDGFFRLARQADDEVAVHFDSILAAMLAEVARDLQRRTPLEVPPALRGAAFESDYEQPRSGFAQSSDRFLVAVPARGRRPLKL